MRRALFTLLVLLLPAVAHAQVPVDALVNLDNVSPAAPGTQLSATILNNGTIGGMTWGSSSGNLAAMTVGPHQSACALGTSVTVAGSTYTSASNSQSYAYNNNSNFSWWTLALPGQTKTSMAGCITLPQNASSASVMDLWEMQDGAGHFVIIQLNTGYCIRMETDGNGTLVSGCVQGQAGASYWCTILDDEVTLPFQVLVEVFVFLDNFSFLDEISNAAAISVAQMVPHESELALGLIQKCSLDFFAVQLAVVLPEVIEIG